MNELLQFVLQSGLVAKTVLIILFIMSVTSWAIIFEKIRLLRKVKKESDKFLHLIQMRTKWADMFTQSRHFKFSPFARIYRKIYGTLPIAGHNPGDRAISFPGAAQDNIMLDKQHSPSPILEVAISEEMSGLEKHLIILATTVSVSPFLGLFGTVWGVMSAFLKMGVTGSANISAVGPGIAEALITTVAGLAVAIPAVVAYNYFVDKFNQLEKDVQNFFTNMIIRIEREK